MLLCAKAFSAHSKLDISETSLVQCSSHHANFCKNKIPFQTMLMKSKKDSCFTVAF